MKKLLLSFLVLFGISCSPKIPTEEKPMPYWEDDYLMVEIMSSKNLKYALAETNRVSKFAEKHSDGSGFSEITPIQEKLVQTNALEIDLNEIVGLLKSVGLKKYSKLMYAGTGEPKIIENFNTKAFGSHQSAIFIEEKNNKIEHIWFSTYDWKNIKNTNIADGLNVIGERYNMIMVDFAGEEVIDLKQKSEIEKYLALE